MNLALDLFMATFFQLLQILIVEEINFKSVLKFSMDCSVIGGELAQ